MKVFLRSINDVRDFSKVALTFPCDIDLVSSRYKVDAKSIMGIFSLNLSKPIELVVSNSNEEDHAKLLFKRWEVK